MHWAWADVLCSKIKVWLCWIWEGGKLWGRHGKVQICWNHQHICTTHAVAGSTEGHTHFSEQWITFVLTGSYSAWTPTVDTLLRTGPHFSSPPHEGTAQNQQEVWAVIHWLWVPPLFSKIPHSLLVPNSLFWFFRPRKLNLCWRFRCFTIQLRSVKSYKWTITARHYLPRNLIGSRESCCLCPLSGVFG